MTVRELVVYHRRRLTVTMRTILFSVITCGVGACFHVPGPEPKRPEVVLHQSFDTTWMAAIAVFAEFGIPLDTVDRGRGMLVAEQDSLLSLKEKFADCGGGMGATLKPTKVVYRVTLSGDSARTVLDVNARWIHMNISRPGTGLVCASTGQWEQSFVRALQHRMQR